MAFKTIVNTIQFEAGYGAKAYLNSTFSTSDKGIALQFVLTDKYNVPITLQNISARLILKMGDGSNYVYMYQVQNGRITHELSEELNHYGEAEGELYILRNEEEITRVHKFGFTVERSLLDESTEVYQKQYVSEFEQLKKKLEETNTNPEVEEKLELNHEYLWSVQSPGLEPVYSSPIRTKFSNNVEVLIYTSWDWFVYVREANTGQLIWRYATADSCYGRVQAADVNGDGKIEIFATSHDGYIYCFDEQGNRIWTFANAYTREGEGKLSSGSTTKVLIDESKDWQNGQFIRGNRDINSKLQINGELYPIEYVEGNKIYLYDDLPEAPSVDTTYKIVQRYESDHYYQHSGTLHEEADGWYLYVTGFDGQIVKLDAETGRMVWRYSTIEGIEPYPWVGDLNNDGVDEVIANCLDGHVYCLSSVDGSLVWKTQFNDRNDSFIRVTDFDGDGIKEVLISSRDNRVHIINGDTGERIGETRDTEGDIDCMPFADDRISGMFFCGTDAGYIYAYDTTGETEWGYKTMNGTNSSMVMGLIDGEPILIQGDMSGGFHFLKPDGTSIKTMYLRGGIEGTPWVEQIDSQRFILYVTTIEGWTYAIRITKKG